MNVEGIRYYFRLLCHVHKAVYEKIYLGLRGLQSDTELQSKIYLISN